MNIIAKGLKAYFDSTKLPYWIVLILDTLIVAVSFTISYLIVSRNVDVKSLTKFLPTILVAMAVSVIGFRLFRTYKGVVRFSSFVDLVKVASACLINAVIFYFIRFIPGFSKVFIVCPFDGILIALLITILLMWAMRVSVRYTYTQLTHDTKEMTKVFIYGTGDGGKSIANSVMNGREYTLKGFITDDKTLPGYTILGYPVYDNKAIAQTMKRHGANALLVSPYKIDAFKENNELIDDLINSDIKIKIYRDSQEWDGKSDINVNNLQDINIEDLLSRKQIEIDTTAIREQLTDKTILITGAAGSIGSELVRQVALFNPKELVLIDQAETPMHDLRCELKKRWPYIKAETIVASITDAEYMDHIFARTKPYYVFHAAAYKHVPMMEDNPAEAVINNCVGTRIIADLAVKYDTYKFVMISTDKAVNPTNVMGCSKRICEIYTQSLNQKLFDEFKASGRTINRGPQFVTTRFGNVLGSNGSVIPLFTKQIKAGGPVTVTHPEIIRYFMLIPEACRLVLEAGVMGKGGEIFVFDMGKPVRIVDLARRMIRLSGVPDIEIVYTGLRDGEKLYEEVLSDQEQTTATTNPKVMVAKVREYDYEDIKRYEEELAELAKGFDNMAIVRKMKEIVPEYKSQNSVYEQLDK